MRTLALVVLMTFGMLLSATHAAVPQTVDYQAYITDAGGSPIHSSAVNVAVALYTVPVGGTPIWFEPHTVAVDQGLFAVRLGSVVPFPPGAFDTELYLGLTVNTDAEMTPRRPLSSVAYALKADDAITLSGMSASSLDQSAHVADTSNPHGVTASQVGAATATDIGAHAGDASAHHTRYSDTEAFSAVLSMDGLGSGLDADLLDGFHASAFVQAGTDFGRFGVASVLYEGTVSLSSRYVNEGQADSVTSAMIANGEVGTADIDFPLDYAGTIADGGLITMTNTRDGSGNDFPAGLLGQSSGDPGAYATYGVMGLAPGLGAGSSIVGLPAGLKYGVAGAVDSGGIGTAGRSVGSGGIGVFGDGAQTGVKGMGPLGPTNGYLGVQGASDFDGNDDLDILGLEVGVLGYSSGSSVGDNYALYGVSNGTGIYAEGAIQAGTFVGNVDVSGDVTADRIAYSSPRTHYYTVGDGDFQSWDGGTFRTSFSDGGAYYTQSSVGALVAGLHLPQGAVITRFDAIVDDRAAGDVTVQISRLWNDANGFTNLASVDSSGSGGYTTLTDTTIAYPVVDNLLCNYHVRVYSTGWPGDYTLRIKSAIVHYTIEEAE